MGERLQNVIISGIGVSYDAGVSGAAHMEDSMCDTVSVGIISVYIWVCSIFDAFRSVCGGFGKCDKYRASAGILSHRNLLQCPDQSAGAVWRMADQIQSTGIYYNRNQKKSAVRRSAACRISSVLADGQSALSNRGGADCLPE